MKNKPLTLSIVIPVFNEEDYLADCLDAIAAQSELPDEVIVVENNSTDKTATVARSYPFVKLMREKKQGVLFARNMGFNTAKSDIIGRIDADTILPRHWVRNAKRTMLNGSTAAITGPVNYYDMPFPNSNHRIDHFLRKSIYSWAPKSPFLFGSNMAIRRIVWLQVSSSLCEAQNIHEDLDLAIHLAKSKQKILYSKSLLSGISGRRYSSSIIEFSNYMSMFRLAYLQHNIHGLAIYSAVGIYWLGYFLLHPLILLGRFIYSDLDSLGNSVYQPRKNPMSD